MRNSSANFVEFAKEVWNISEAMKELMKTPSLHAGFAKSNLNTPKALKLMSDIIQGRNHSSAKFVILVLFQKVDLDSIWRELIKYWVQEEEKLDGKPQIVKVDSSQLSELHQNDFNSMREELTKLKDHEE